MKPTLQILVGRCALERGDFFPWSNFVVFPRESEVVARKDGLCLKGMMWPSCRDIFLTGLKPDLEYPKQKILVWSIRPFPGWLVDSWLDSFAEGQKRNTSYKQCCTHPPEKLMISELFWNRRLTRRCRNQHERTVFFLQKKNRSLLVFSNVVVVWQLSGIAMYSYV